MQGNDGHCKPYFARSHESSLKLYNATAYFDNGSFSNFWRGEDAKTAREKEIEKQKEEYEKEKKLSYQRSEQAFRDYISKFSLEEKWNYFMERNAFLPVDFIDVHDYVGDERPFWEEWSWETDTLERYSIDLDEMEIISLSDCVEIKYINGKPYIRNVKPGVAKVGYRPKGTDFLYAWEGCCVCEKRTFIYKGKEYETHSDDTDWDYYEKEAGKYYTAPYTNWDMYPDEQWVDHSDMLYDYMYKSYDLSYYFNEFELKNLTVETSDPDVMSVWKCKNGKLVNVDTGEKKGNFDTVEGYYACFPTDVKETGKTKVNITLSMKGSKQKKVIHITLFERPQ